MNEPADPRQREAAVAERQGLAVNGYAALLAILVLAAAGVALIASGTTAENPGQSALGFLPLALSAILLRGVYVLAPNESAVFLLFGSYSGSDSQTGLRLTNPFYTRSKVSRRLRTHEIAALKVNDAAGNPIEIGAAVVWSVSDAAAALLEIDDYESFVRVQSDAALRRIAGSHAYDAEEVAIAQGSPEGPPVPKSRATLLDGGDEVVQGLVRELQDRVRRAGIRIEEARITHLAYAPEIAGAMLRRQQAEAVLAARRKIVAGAVDMVEDALAALERKGLSLEPERRTAMVANLLVVLVGDKDATPVINTGAMP
ncbi:SPFH domain-containing protein [Pseudoroseomonas wenyumeiae]|uniref:SPFH domain-containing protein n=1 Tax=Teichococcus wenyumeiae TaxID=2478470 RepID=A0A3A9JE03_9PROT|nr:SPFH domain-containing protein [Pseudoroseomonas wenyumeiae]RKK04450.1 SPFH domain-containing protein [Pseudoroseomonas wenyumeiae]RMI25373.1 SPFH domain-containing protein [Pseudoroseomonas wenyumeiae]